MPREPSELGSEEKAFEHQASGSSFDAGGGGHSGDEGGRSSTSDVGSAAVEKRSAVIDESDVENVLERVDSMDTVDKHQLAPNSMPRSGTSFSSISIGNETYPGSTPEPGLDQGGPSTEPSGAEASEHSRIGESGFEAFTRRVGTLGMDLDLDTMKKYYSVLQQFFQAYCTKSELEKRLREILSRDKIALHNQFVRDLLHKAIHADGIGIQQPPDALTAARHAKREDLTLFSLRPFLGDDVTIALRNSESVRAANRKRVAGAKRRRSGTRSSYDAESVTTSDGGSATDGRLEKVIRSSSRLRQSAANAISMGQRLKSTGTRATREFSETDQQQAILAAMAAGHPASMASAFLPNKQIYEQAVADLHKRELLKRSEQLDHPGNMSAAALALSRRNQIAHRRTGGVGSSNTEPGFYNTLPFYPIPPTTCIDVELFLKLQRYVHTNIERIDASITNDGVLRGRPLAAAAFDRNASTQRSHTAKTGVGWIRGDAIAMLAIAVEMRAREWIEKRVD